MDARTHLQRLGALLEKTGDLWRQRPFTGLPVPWEESWPQLSQALRSLSFTQVIAYENNPIEIPSVRKACPELVSELKELSDWGPLETSGKRAALPMPIQVHARKWAQVEHFVGVVERLSPQPIDRWIDWCAGKGRLGRALAEVGAGQTICVEKELDLCQKGTGEAQKLETDIIFRCADVLQEDLKHLVEPRTGLVALHSCGDLGIALLRLCVETNAAFVALAPCCYQRITGMNHHPLSQTAAENPVALTRHQLRLPSLDDSIYSETGRQLRLKEHAWRLAVDLLQRQSTGCDAYLPLGRIPKRWLKGSFADFVTRITEREGIPLPRRFQPDAAEERGWQRLHITSALSLARGLFRRALESWLVLDRALYLEENGYRARIGTFCPAEYTPRNLMIAAHLQR